MEDNIISLIYREYYEKVFRYCRMNLNGDFYAAQDCTQEVFLVLHKKIKKLVKMDSILPWLYRTADIEIKKYRRKNPEMLNIDELPENEFLENIEIQQSDTIIDMLDEEERKLIELYYSGENKYLIAKELGISMDSLYKKLYRIRKKLKENLGDSNK